MESIQRACATCQAVFETTSERQIYCSKKCRAKVFNAARTERIRVRDFDKVHAPKVCLNCNQLFSNGYKTQKHCSIKCRDIHDKRLRKERRIAGRPCKVCIWCKVEFIAEHWASKCCSEECWKQWTLDKSYTWRKRNPEKVRDSLAKSRRKVQYGISEEDYNKLLVACNGKCMICGGCQISSPNKPRLEIDHDHKTGAIRGLLCSPCNTGLGHFKDDPTLLLLAYGYLKQHRGGG